MGFVFARSGVAWVGCVGVGGAGGVGGVVCTRYAAVATYVISRFIRLHLD